ncbi:MAG TPA: hypothetical protein VES20_13740, partial [Bryobacteraceae bacterium]|nr:hypothetical protein [Bryobacteraceae bacterium]
MKMALASLSRSMGCCLAAALLPHIVLAQGQLTCDRVDMPLSVRAEGMAELVSDIVLKCTGGTPAPRGGVVPKFQVIVAANTRLTSRVLVPGTTGTGMSEALLVVDEPLFAEQVGCASASSGDACPALAGAASSPNVFQGRKTQDNTITFRSVPLDPPGTQAVRTIRITNLRANLPSLLEKSPRVST